MLDAAMEADNFDQCIALEATIKKIEARQAEVEALYALLPQLEAATAADDFAKCRQLKAQFEERELQPLRKKPKKPPANLSVGEYSTIHAVPHALLSDSYILPYMCMLPPPPSLDTARSRPAAAPERRRAEAGRGEGGPGLRRVRHLACGGDCAQAEGGHAHEAEG
jgi:hypothetical protein